MNMDIIQKTQKKVETSKKKLSKTIALKSYKKLAINFLILTANLIIIILYFSLSQAKIVIVPTKSDLEQSSLIAIKDSSEAKDGEIFVPGRIINTNTQHEQTFTVSSTSQVEKNAKGKVTIYNITSDRDQTFVKDTRFQNAGGIEIKIEKMVKVPPGGKITVDAYASEIGAKGEVTSQSGKFQVVALPYLKDKIYAEVTQNFTGGRQDIKVVTLEAFNEARDAMINELKKKTIEILSQTSSENIKQEDIAVEMTELKSTANPGDENIETFTMSATGTSTAFYYDQEAAREIIKQELIKKISPDKILASFNEDSFKAEIDKEKMMLNISISAKLQTKIPESILSQKDITGMNQDEVREYFTKITGIRDIEIKFWPFWVRSVPNMESHVDIEIKK
jgi:hypothetical protein